MYQGSPNGKRRLQKGLGLGGDIIIRMAQGLVKGKTYKVFADNFFTNLPFVKAPKDKSIHFRGHISCKSLQGVSPEDGKRAEAALTSQTSIRHIILSAIKTRSGGTIYSTPLSTCASCRPTSAESGHHTTLRPRRPTATCGSVLTSQNSSAHDSPAESMRWATAEQCQKPLLPLPPSTIRNR